jgi:putative chitinase
VIDRKKFFDEVRFSPFGGEIHQDQVEGMEWILGEWEHRGLTEPRWLAYMLATVFHETARKMQPIEEMGGQAYLRSKPYYPWYGRGLVQITWLDNYKKFGIATPEAALEWPTALKVLFEGMIGGMFTAYKLADFFSDEFDDPLNARRIINGVDKANLVAGYHQSFLRALALSASTGIVVTGPGVDIKVEGNTIVRPPQIPLPPVIPPAPKPKPGFWARVFGRKA